MAAGRLLPGPKSDSGTISAEAVPGVGLGLAVKFRLGAPDVLLHRLPEFIRLFLSGGLLPDLVYALGLKTV